MSKSNPQERARPVTVKPAAALFWVIVIGLSAQLGLSAWIVSELGTLRREVADKAAQLDTKIAQLEVAKPQPQKRGPDPNKTYTIRTDRSPVKGNPAAPVTIAEFSDFQ